MSTTKKTENYKLDKENDRFKEKYTENRIYRVPK